MVGSKPTEPRKIVDDTAGAIKRLVEDLESKQQAGDVITTREIQRIAGQLHAHVRDLLAASNSLRADGANGAGVKITPVAPQDDSP